ncbi:rod shape-determining protein RodA [Cytobacillus sp. FSL W7-1323]|uniref:Rod shape-determining protein RodA n=1 Tax=Cytobacillus kochii TaxID=859143 RepID=A0A248TJN1_9BACI|nr:MULTISPECIES: rod shape-determining protein RodA [Cytobacillus]ASV68407.1 rod shape-determining protein RodA [Cytobacillus kochii]MCA1027910.1 rod shape-determining protein RodA [Cytobacillus kochii]MCM3324881.1 rod shape-determining protein RodA [Cytobacillus kochii]MCM3347327.1 rod shape-determining protein RodA [Cytobacillus kochii]MDM5209126.1 rod shape-determining protein RodA [Cytobacillus kochii]
MTSKRTTTSRIDYTLVLILFLLFLVSCISIYSAQTTEQYGENFLLKQIVWYVVGIGIILAVITLDAEQLKKISWYAYGFGLLLLGFLVVAPESIAPVINGAKSWIRLPGLGQIQPAELVKVFLILALARVIDDHHQKTQLKTVKTDFFLLFKMLIVTGFPLLLIMQQPDLGTSLVILAILLGMVFISGITWKILAPIVSVGVTLVVGIFYFVLWHPELLEKYLGVKEYQLGRIYSWIDPYNYQSSTGFQLTRSLLAIGSGETTGKGYGTREVYLPESHTDFIFSIIGEEFGFIGASVVVSLFFLLIYHLTKIGISTRTPFYTYVCVGVISLITFHVFQNIGMTIGVLPITGIPLPFISYGGSSLMGNMLAMGLIFSIGFHSKRYMFSRSS